MPTLMRLLFVTLIMLGASVRADVNPDCVDRGLLSRYQAMVEVQTLQVELLSHDSATETLERWCKRRGQVNPAIITAERVTTIGQRPSPEIREYLRVGRGVALKFRHVRLKCGDMVLSEADNWYVPARLTPVMNKMLDNSDRPFGKVVKTMGFTRHTLSATMLWSPLTDPGQTLLNPPSEQAEDLPPPHVLFEHKALLQTANGTPFSLLVERYTRNLLKPTRSP